MSNTVFSARFTPTSSTPLSSDTFQVSGDIFDGTGIYSGLDVELDDVLFLDTFNSITAPGSISRYVVLSIISSGISSVQAIFQYADTGSPVDPGEVIGNPGFVARASVVQGLAYHAAPTLHTIPDYVTQYARNYDSYIKLETALSSISAVDASVIKGLFLNSTGSSIAALTPVKQNGSGLMASVDPSSETDIQNYLGVLTQTTANGNSGAVAFSGLIKNVSTSFVLGDILYLSKTGGLTATAPEIGSNSFLAGDFVLKVGKITKNSTNGAQKDFKVEVELRGQL